MSAETDGAAVTSPKRLTALGGAVLITLLTCAGALGIGPGAAMGETSPPAHGASPPPQPTGGASDGRPGAHSGGDSWVTVTNSPAPPPPASDNSAAPQSGSSQPADPLAVPAHSGHGKRIVYDISAQRVWLVAGSGQTARTYRVSGSRNEHLLDPGTYAVYSKSRNAVSFDSKETMNYMVRFTSGKRSPIGFHDIPARSDGTLVESRSDLGTPQSAGCIRQWISDAKALWDFAPVGTPVVVTA